MVPVPVRRNVVRPFNCNGVAAALVVWRLGHPFTAGAFPGDLTQGRGLVTNWRVDVFEYRQTLTRMVSGDTNRALAHARLMGPRKATEARHVAEAADWLDPTQSLLKDAELAHRVGCRTVNSSSLSLAEPFRKQMSERWNREIQAPDVLVSSTELRVLVPIQSEVDFSVMNAPSVLQVNTEKISTCSLKDCWVSTETFT